MFIPYQEGYIIFNTFTGALGKIDEEQYKRFIQDTLNSSETELLVKKGILIPVDFDEKKKIDSDRENGIIKSDFKNFRIWPTSGCNARCYYCFEKGISAENLSIETARQVINFIDTKTTENDTLRIEWFGGEPLLNTPAIDLISAAVKSICDRKHCKYDSLLITNGSLITKSIAQKIRYDWNIKLVQITLDGFNSDYDKIKNYSDASRFSFYRIINNIHLLLNLGVRVAIRMNYDTSNYDSLENLIDYLHEEFQGFTNISYYLYPIWSSENYFTSTVADIKLISLFEKLILYKMTTMQKIARIGYKKHACQSWHKDTLTILPNGDLAKCCESFNQVIGNIYDGITDMETFAFWTNNTLDEACEKCIYLPMCQGGCKASNFTLMPQCFALKPIMHEYLKWCVKFMDENKGFHSKSQG